MAPSPGARLLAVPPGVSSPTPGSDPQSKPCRTDACRACVAAAPLPPGREVLVHDATLGRGLFAGTCAARGELGSPAAPERIYRIDVTAPTRLEADTLGSSFDTLLYLKSGCEEGPELACSDDALGTYQSALAVDLDPGAYHLFVDGYESWDSGAFTLRVSLEPITQSPRFQARR
jgi:hypothetical protein